MPLHRTVAFDTVRRLPDAAALYPMWRLPEIFTVEQPDTVIEPVWL